MALMTSKAGNKLAPRHASFLRKNQRTCTVPREAERSNCVQQGTGMIHDGRQFG